MLKELGKFAALSTCSVRLDTLVFGYLRRIEHMLAITLNVFWECFRLSRYMA